MSANDETSVQGQADGADQVAAAASPELGENDLDAVAGGSIVGDIVDAVETAYLEIKRGIMCDK